MAITAVAISGCAWGSRSATVGEGGAVDVQLAQSAAAGRTAFDRDQLGDARSSYERALTRARAMDDPRAVADQAYNLAVCLLRLGEPDKAALLLDEAEQAALRGRLLTADILLLEAVTARQQGQLIKSTDLALRVLSGMSQGSDPDVRLQAHALIGLNALQGQNLDEARLSALNARKEGSRSQDPAALSALSGLEAGLAEAASQHAVAAGKYDQQAGLLQRARLFREMARALLKSGRAYSAAGQDALATDRLLRSAQSSAAQGDLESAADVARAASAAAAMSGDPALQKRSAVVLKEVTAAIPLGRREPPQQALIDEGGARAPRRK